MGDGDAIFIQSPSQENCLIDTGNLITGFKVTKYLEQQGIDSLDHLIFTHSHLDHIGGAFFVLQMFDVKNVYDNGECLSESVDLQDIHSLYRVLLRTGGSYRSLNEGDAITLGAVKLNVLWPPKEFSDSGINANSIIIMVEYEGFSCLLTGDLINSVEKLLIEKEIILKADVLKVGHHGAADANSEEFLNKVSPGIAIISVGEENTRGYPSGDVIERINKSKIKLYRTDKDGDVLLNIYKEKPFNIKIKTSKE